MITVFGDAPDENKEQAKSEACEDDGGDYIFEPSENPRVRVHSSTAIFLRKNKAEAKTSAFGRGGRTRTHDPWFWRPVLYQLSYTPTRRDYYTRFFSVCQDVLRKKLEKFIKSLIASYFHKIY